MEATYKITWDDELGEGWMNKYNLELCLFSKEHIGGKAKEVVKVEECTLSLPQAACNCHR